MHRQRNGFMSIFFEYQEVRTMPKQRLLIYVVILALVLSACSPLADLSDPSSIKGLSEPDKPSTPVQETLPKSANEVIESADLVEEAEYYAIFRYGSVQYYFFMIRAMM